ncbi:MAG: dTDP-4-dehydrorhamnose 3,5-epimerase [Flavobacteriales bacterium]|nr:dTDP-4-dehydrorhamnose 3,5-epimerase [Flavobacteriales bacterium]|tara:strand:+ start:13433 stop:13996 length:564 start_codon:yes stop_codon:yes gene_type:complete
MEIKKTDLDGVFLLKPTVFGDHRGFFMESYTKRKFEEIGIDYDLIQDNHSLSTESGTLRGLHYQTNPMALTKIVRCIRGEILDVVVDIRKGSPTFGKWISAKLSAENKMQIVVPKGFAHGICTLEDNTEIMYKVDQYYSPEHDKGVLWSDPELGIEWLVENPILSEKDKEQPLLKDAENNFEYGVNC